MANRPNKSNYKGKSRPDRKGRDDRDKRNSKDKDPREEMETRDRDNDPNWYFGDKALADQTSALSFQQLAGYSIDTSEASYPIGNIVALPLTPCPGVVQGAGAYNTIEVQKYGINMAGFKLFSKLSAYTGRIATYSPGDVSMMILYMGEVISAFEWVRRCFGVANIYSMRNRAYPRAVLRALRVDPDDLYASLANYRMKYNSLITLLNQVPIPKGLPYFEKCASLFEKIYVDAPSPMAQTLFWTLGTTWTLDETSDPNGTRLVTTGWNTNLNDGGMHQVEPMSWYLTKLESMVQALLNSSSFQVVYTDLLNLSVKLGTKFWVFDYLFEGYTVAPEFNQNFMLQVHNCTINGFPVAVTNDNHLVSDGVTPRNDVVSCPAVNGIYYNPALSRIIATDNKSLTVMPENQIIDMLTPEPSVEDRVEVLRFTSSCGTRSVAVGSNYTLVDNSFPDHYVNAMVIFKTDNTEIVVTHAITDKAGISLIAPYLSVVDWAPRLYECDDSVHTLTGAQVGDLNYYTVVTPDYIRRLNNFITQYLYDIH